MAAAFGNQNQQPINLILSISVRLVLSSCCYFYLIYTDSGGGTRSAKYSIEGNLGNSRLNKLLHTKERKHTLSISSILFKFTLIYFMDYTEVIQSYGNGRSNFIVSSDRLETTESEVWGILCKEVMGGNIKF